MWGVLMCQIERLAINLIARSDSTYRMPSMHFIITFWNIIKSDVHISEICENLESPTHAKIAIMSTNQNTSMIFQIWSQKCKSNFHSQELLCLDTEKIRFVYSIYQLDTGLVVLITYKSTSKESMNNTLIFLYRCESVQAHIILTEMKSSEFL